MIRRRTLHPWPGDRPFWRGSVAKDGIRSSLAANGRGPRGGRPLAKPPWNRLHRDVRVRQLHRIRGSNIADLFVSLFFFVSTNNCHQFSRYQYHQVSLYLSHTLTLTHTMDNEEWFPLKQTHYPPPSIPSMKTGHPTGPISIGHIIPDLRHLDNVINCKGFEPFPPNMDVFTAHYEQCHFGDHLNSEFVVQAKAEAPIKNVVPVVDVTGSAGLHHTNITSDRWEYDSVEEYAAYPTRQYIDRLLESKEVKQYIQKSKKLLGRWCVYMVTGIMVARGGGKNVVSEEKGAGVFGNVGL